MRRAVAEAAALRRPRGCTGTRRRRATTRSVLRVDHRHEVVEHVRGRRVLPAWSRSRRRSAARRRALPAVERGQVARRGCAPRRRAGSASRRGGPRARGSRVVEPKRMRPTGSVHCGANTTRSSGFALAATQSRAPRPSRRPRRGSRLHDVRAELDETHRGHERERPPPPRHRTRRRGTGSRRRGAYHAGDCGRVSGRRPTGHCV